MHGRMDARSRRRGFTLIELLLVLVILGILAAVVVPRFASRPEQARETRVRTDIARLDTALDTFQLDCGRYPTTEEGLRALVEAPPNATGWREEYIKGGGVPKDPWGNAYQYRRPGQRNPSSYDLYSAGADGQPGTSDDIGNWTTQ